jgi:superfamily II DNA or RNA helicase
MSFALRNYQQDIIDRTRKELQSGLKRVLIQLPTGGGKTAIASYMIKSAHERGFVCWFVCNRQELVDQTARSLYKIGIPFSYIAAGYDYDDKKNVFVCSIQTLNRRIATIKKKPKMIYWDETRGIAAKSWSSVFWNFPDAFHIGLDATPCRLSGEPLSDYYQKMVKGPSVSWLMDEGYLCKYKIFAPKVANFEGVKTRMGDYVISDLDSIMNQKKILGNAVKEYQKHASGKRNLVFCNSIMHSENLCNEFIEHGIKAESIDGMMGDVERKAVLKRFESGETKVVTSVELVTAGFDLPAIECVTLERATQSVALAKQMIGRGLRPHEGKDKLIILDHVNMWQSHGLPDDDIDWSLEGSRKPKKLSEKSVKQCEKCYFVFEPNRRDCPECGHAPEIKHREVDMEHTDDELAEIDPNMVRKQAKQEQAMAQSKEDLERLGIARYGAHKGRRWAHHVFQARQAKKLRGL